MSLHLPLARGTVTHLVSLREHLDPARLLLEGPSALPDAASAEDREAVDTVGAILVTPGGAVALADPGPAIEPARSQLRLRRAHPELVARLLDEGARPLLIGATPSREAVIALVLETPDAAPGRWAPMRRYGHLLQADDSALALAALALASWHAQARFCQGCGTRVAPILGGWASECPACGRQEYPRQDPAVIVALVDEEERLLLAHNASWQRPLASLIAGFVEAGETPERAVEREVGEEVGLMVDEPVYRATQPWPFPRSQMLGFSATLAAASRREPVPDGVEIDWARFYTRGEFAREVLAGVIAPPGPSSIAHALVSEWFGEALPDSPLSGQTPERP